MNFLPLQQRESLAELMDAPDVDPAAHRLALAGLARINRTSRAAAGIAAPIVALARREGLRALTILDVACGGGDVAVAVAGKLRRAGIGVELCLSDKSEEALREAEVRAGRAKVSARCEVGEAPHRLPEGKFDVVINSLFLHHLTSMQAVQTLGALAERARRLVVVSDLRRSVAAWGIAWAGCRVLSRSPIVHYDGPVSVRCAWTVREMQKMAAQAGMAGARVAGCFPWRMLLTWQPEGPRD